MKPILLSLFVLAYGAARPFAAAADTEPITPPGATVEAARASLSKWVETQQLISKEWREGKELLQARSI